MNVSKFVLVIEQNVFYLSPHTSEVAIHSVHSQTAVVLSPSTTCVCESVIVWYILLCSAYLTSPLSNHVIFRIYRGCVVHWLNLVAFTESLKATLRPLWNPAGLIQHFQSSTFISEPD